MDLRFQVFVISFSGYRELKIIHAKGSQFLSGLASMFAWESLRGRKVKENELIFNLICEFFIFLVKRKKWEWERS